MEEYNKKVLEHFVHPRNLGVIDDADGIGEVGSKECGDYLKICIKVNDKEEIADIKFKIHGCVAAIATSSAVTEIAKGLNVYEAMMISEQDIIDFLGGLPEEKIHCSVLGAKCMEAAVKNYMLKKGHLLESEM